MISLRESWVRSGWRLLVDQAELHGLRIGNPMERPRQQTKLEQRQGLTISMSVLGGVVFNRCDTGTMFLEGMVCGPYGLGVQALQKVC